MGTVQWFLTASLLQRSNLCLTNSPTDKNYKNWIKNQISVSRQVGVTKAATTQRTESVLSLLRAFSDSHCRTKRQNRKQWPKSFTGVQAPPKKSYRQPETEDKTLEKKGSTEMQDQHPTCNFFSVPLPNSQMYM